jgi:hypothetical protein
MSASLIVLLPIMLLGIVSVFCFVGCGLIYDYSGYTGAFTQYSKLIVLGDPTIVAAYWPLDEAAVGNPPRASDHGPNSPPNPPPNLPPPLHGKYVNQSTLMLPPPTLGVVYPWPQDSIPTPPALSAAGANMPDQQLKVGQPGLVKGDAKQPGNDPAILTTCMVVDGGYVEVPFDSRWNPPASFTLEACVTVGWQADPMVDPRAWRAVLDGRGQNPQDPNAMCQGFAIIAMPDDKQPLPPAPPVYHWTVIVGNGLTGSSGFTILPDTGPPIALFNPSPPLPEQPPAVVPVVYLAVTYDGTTLTLYVNDQPPVSTSASYIPNTASPLYIGAGAPYSPNRQTGGSASGGPLFPYRGAIQDVAIYNVALGAAAIQDHFKHGSGNL